MSPPPPPQKKPLLHTRSHVHTHACTHIHQAGIPFGVVLQLRVGLAWGEAGPSAWWSVVCLSLRRSGAGCMVVCGLSIIAGKWGRVHGGLCGPCHCWLEPNSTMCGGCGHPVQSPVTTMALFLMSGPALGAPTNDDKLGFDYAVQEVLASCGINATVSVASWTTVVSGNSRRLAAASSPLAGAPHVETVGWRGGVSWTGVTRMLEKGTRREATEEAHRLLW
jgi:hypothetical protein